MLMDTELPNNILLDYVESLRKEDCTDLMKDVCGLQLTLDQFIHNLPVIYLMYKKSQKNDIFFQHILANLELCNICCAYNENYGRLLLCLIQNLSRNDERTLRVIEIIIENHFSIYKSVCQTAFDKFVLSVSHLQQDIDEILTIVILRQVENVQSL